MIGIQGQQKQTNFLNRSQRRSPLNVVVEKIGTSTVVHGDLSKESLKELLMSELSLIPKATTLTKGISKTTIKDTIDSKEEGNISKDSKKPDSVKDGQKVGQKGQKKNEDISEGAQKDTTDTEKEVPNNRGEQRNEETETTEKDKKTDTTRREIETEQGEDNKKDEINKINKSAKKNEKQYPDKVIETTRKNKLDKKINVNKKKEFNKKYRETRDSLQNKRKTDMEANLLTQPEVSIDEAYNEVESSFHKMSDEEENDLSYDSKWLKKYLREPLVLAMNEIIEKKPCDPVNYLGFWLLNYKNCQENRKSEKKSLEELLEKRNEWKMLHEQAEESPELMLERTEREHEEEEENFEEWNFTNYEAK